VAKMTLLEIVQDILNDMDSDEVSSITDTTEAQQVAQIVKTAYFKLMSRRDDWPFLRTLTAFTGLGDTDNPTKMKMPDGMGKVYWVKYNGQDVSYLDPKSFKDTIDNRVETTGVVDADGYVIDSDPKYWTTYDDTYVFFDGYDSDTESTLTQARCDVYAIVAPTWDHADDAIPTLPEKMFPLLLSDAKGTAFLTLKQQANAKEEQFAAKGIARAQVTANRTNDGEPKYGSQVNYGRK
jgi:hypothetical protein